MGVVKHPCILLHALLTITFIPLGYNSQWRDKVGKNWARSLHNQNMKQKPWKISQQFFSALCTMSSKVVSSLFWVIWTSFQQLLQKPAQVSKTNTDIDTHHYETLIKKMDVRFIQPRRHFSETVTSASMRYFQTRCNSNQHGTNETGS